MSLPEPRFACAGLVVEGLSFLAGKPKLGKSWLALQLAVAVAFGDFWLGEQCEQGAVLYVALEDSKRRLQARMRKALDHRVWPSSLHMATECPRLNEGGLVQISTWLKDHPDARLVIIDTLAKVKPLQKKNGDVYAEDSAAGSSLQKLAFKHNVAAVVVTHTRKADTDDFLESVTGTLGLTGAADSILVLKRDRQATEGTLSVTGRDIEERELALSFLRDRLWVALGASADVRMSPERREILDAFRSLEFTSGASPAMTPAQIAKVTGKSATAIQKLLIKMKAYGQVHSGLKFGTWLPGPLSASTGESGESGPSVLKGSAGAFTGISHLTGNSGERESKHTQTLPGLLTLPINPTLPTLPTDRQDEDGTGCQGTRADTANRVIPGDALGAKAPDCSRCKDLDLGRSMGSRSTAPCDACGAARPLPGPSSPAKQASASL